MVSVALSRSRTSLISLLPAASARVNEAAKSCQGHLQPLRESLVYLLAYSKMEQCQCTWFRTRQILRQQNARRHLRPSMVCCHILALSAD